MMMYVGSFVSVRRILLHASLLEATSFQRNVVCVECQHGALNICALSTPSADHLEIAVYLKDTFTTGFGDGGGGGKVKG